MKELPKINPNQPIAIDLETCDPELKFLAPGYISKVGFVAGFAVAAKEGSFYIPVGHARGENYPLEDVVAWLNEVCSGDTDKVFHNGQYDIGWLKYVGVTLNGRVFDTMLAAALLDENRRSYTLDSIGNSYLGEGKNEVALEMAVKSLFENVKTRKVVIRIREHMTKQLGYQPFYEAKQRVSQLYDVWPDSIKRHYDVVDVVKNARTGADGIYKMPTKTQEQIKGLLWAVDAEEMGSYPIQDVDLTYRLYKHFLPLLQEQNLIDVMNLENELLPCLLEMREQGVKIDIEKAVLLDKQYSELLQKSQNLLDALAGFHVNVDAETDLVELCNKLSLKYGYTAKGKPCFSAENVPEHKAFEYVLQIRKLNKARNTYIRGYCFGSSIEGRLHGQYNQLKSDDGGTVTGRLSSSNPNLQNIPARGEVGEQMRSMFIPDTPEEQWLCMDFSGQEPKMLVNLVLLLDKKFGTRQVKNMRTGEVTLIKEEGFPGATLAAQPEFAGREADFHTAVAKKCMEVENKHKGLVVTEEELNAQAKGFRKKAKSIGLGVMYGSGNKKVAEEMTKKGEPMTENEAAELRQSIYDGVPFLDAINKYVMDIAKRRGYVLTLLKRRGRFEHWEIPIYKMSREDAARILKKTLDRDSLLFPSQREAQNWMSSDECAKLQTVIPGELGRPQRAFTYKALNKIIQGSSSDQTKTAMLKIYKRCNLDVRALDIYYRKEGVTPPPKFRAQVHDELNFSITKDDDINWFQNTMENSLPMMVQSVAEPGVGANWNEAK